MISLFISRNRASAYSNFKYFIYGFPLLMNKEAALYIGPLSEIGCGG